MMYYRISKNEKILFFGKKIAQVWAVTLKMRIDLTLHKANSYLYIHVYLTFSSFVLFRVASSPDQQGRYVRTRVLSSRPFTIKRGYVGEHGSSGRRFAKELQTDIQTTGNETAGLLDQVPGPRDVNHSLLACLWFFVRSSPDHLIYRS